MLLITVSKLNQEKQMNRFKDQYVFMTNTDINSFVSIATSISEVNSLALKENTVVKTIRKLG